jgi:hypothetical protein
VFDEVKPLKTSASEAIEVFLAGARRLLVRRGFDRDLLIELVGLDVEERLALMLTSNTDI